MRRGVEMASTHFNEPKKPSDDEEQTPGILVALFILSAAIIGLAAMAVSLILGFLVISVQGRPC